MGVPEFDFNWLLTSTGAGTVNADDALKNCQRLTIIADCLVAGDTATIGIESGPNSTGFFDRMGSTAYTISSGAAVTIQLSGPLLAIRPYYINRTASTSSVRIRVVGN